MDKIHLPGRRLGFTIIELMIVAVIIGVLAAIAFPSYRIQMMKVRNQEAIRILLALGEAEMDYFQGLFRVSSG